MNTQPINNNFNQNTDFMRVSHESVNRVTTRVRCFFHDTGLLLVSVVNYSLDTNTHAGKEQTELHFWKRDQGGISNA